MTRVPATRLINAALVCRKSPPQAFALFAVLIFAPLAHVVAEEDTPASCTDDAVLVFDASGSMMSSDKDLDGLKRIDRVREAMRKVLPTIAPKKRLGLVTYGPGSANKCENIKVEFTPRLDAATRILEVVEALRPDGRTPLTRAVRTAADVPTTASAPP